MAGEFEIENGVVLDDETEFTLGELCRACSTHAEWLISLVEEGILEPSGGDRAHWRFSGVQLRRARIVFHLQRDLDINLAGAGLALNLIDEIDALRARLEVLERTR